MLLRLSCFWNSTGCRSTLAVSCRWKDQGNASWTFSGITGEFVTQKSYEFLGCVLWIYRRQLSYKLKYRPVFKYVTIDRPIETEQNFMYIYIIICTELYIQNHGNDNNNFYKGEKFCSFIHLLEHVNYVCI